METFIGCVGEDLQEEFIKVILFGNFEKVKKFTKDFLTVPREDSHPIVLAIDYIHALVEMYNKDY